MTMTMTLVMIMANLTICKILILITFMMGMNVLDQCHLYFGKVRLCKVSYQVGGWGSVGGLVVWDEYKEWLGGAIQ